MNRIHRARCIRRSGGIQAGLAGALLASITAEQARRRMTRSVKRTRPAASSLMNHTAADDGNPRKVRPWLS
jgi:hypothetical protein